MHSLVGIYVIALEIKLIAIKTVYVACYDMYHECTRNFHFVPRSERTMKDAETADDFSATWFQMKDTQKHYILST